MLAEDAIKAADWHYSTYISPHEYMLFRENPEVYRAILARIKLDGVPGKFYGRTYRYWFFGDYKYWCVKGVINRVKV